MMKNSRPSESTGSNARAPATPSEARGAVRTIHPDRFRVARYLVVKDFRLLMRGAPISGVVGLYGILMLAILSFAVDPGSAAARAWAGPLLWIVFWFTGETLIHQSFEREQERPVVEIVLAAVQHPELWFWSKVCANTIAMFGLHAVMIGVFTVFFDWEWHDRLGMFAVTWISTMTGYTIVGHLLGAALVGHAQRGLLYPMMLFPLLLGVFLIAARVTTMIFSGAGWHAILGPLRILWIADVLNGIVALLFIPHLMRDE